ncbi:hypothetical protein E2C01_064857 [Portunus trituberculatus]|uniref:Uncharacterized protein n=1 Tax=Portunus trituberculatus TaxID=210409 RepID=A0A5B7HKA6_PORTR|nr:hypothetical protein [Portunus trituberculatus]
MTVAVAAPTLKSIHPSIQRNLCLGYQANAGQEDSVALRKADEAESRGNCIGWAWVNPGAHPVSRYQIHQVVEGERQKAVTPLHQGRVRRQTPASSIETRPVKHPHLTPLLTSLPYRQDSRLPACSHWSYVIHFTVESLKLLCRNFTWCPDPGAYRLTRRSSYCCGEMSEELKQLVGVRAVAKGWLVRSAKALIRALETGEV